jgi:pantoate ligase/cytidylate kinase
MRSRRGKYFCESVAICPGEDFAQYPRNLEHDRQFCQDLGVDAIFAPTVAELLPHVANANTETVAQVTQVMPPDPVTKIMEGASRPGHFTGVATIVTKLLHIVQPDRAYFGQKDAQQLAILRQMVCELDFKVQIVGCPIVRADDGLALSSRNQYLDPQQRQAATVIYRSLQAAQQAFKAGTRSADLLKEKVHACLATEPLVKLDYLELVDAASLKSLVKIGNDSGDNAADLTGSDRTGTETDNGDRFSGTALLAIAAYVGKTRLIDNILLRDRQPIIAIDGPAGAGKSTVTRAVARHLNLLFIDTGAMYRAITLAALRANLDPGNPENYAQIAEIAAQSKIELLPAPSPQQPQLVKLNGEDITAAIRSQQVTAQVSAIAAQAYVRQILTEKQRQIGKTGAW